MKSKRIMIQGTASTVGKSVLSAALCRIFYQDGYQVCPFKSQNMSSKVYETDEGLFISISQANQAKACGRSPEAYMNPVLLKPRTDRKSDVYIEGKLYASMDANEYFSFKPRLKGRIGDIFRQLEKENDIIVIEGAGSPAEINLKKEDFVNMGMAKIAKAPVILVGDIDRGGVFASIVGTIMLLDEDERKYIKGVVINKFRGSYELLKPGIKILEDIIKLPVLGVLPYMKEKETPGYDEMADLVRRNLDIERIYSILEERIDA